MRVTTPTRSRRAAVRKGYGYSCARIRGMRSRLLKPAFFDQLMEAEDIARMIKLLEETAYEEDIDAELIRGRTADTIDDALKVNIVRTFHTVLRVLNDEAFCVVTALLGRWDLFNIKSIIRGKHVHLTPEQIEESLYPVGQMSAIEVGDLARQADVTAVADTLATWGSPYAKPLREAMPDYVRDGDLAALELGLDRYYSAWAHEQLKGKKKQLSIAQRILGIQIDSINLLTAFRLLKADLGGLDPMRLFLPGGARVSEPLFLQLSGLSDVDEVLDALKATPYAAALDEAGITYIETGSISAFERALEDYVMRKSLAAGLEDPMGVGLVISYLWAKQNEVTNLRIIVKGKTVNMPPERMKKELILV